MKKRGDQSMDMTIKLAAEEFVRFIRSSQEMREFQSVRERYNKDPEISKLREEFLSLGRQLQQKQYDNSITQAEIERYKELQKRLSSYHLSREYAQVQQQLIQLLQACNEGLSEVLGFDFAATAAPTAAC